MDVNEIHICLCSPNKEYLQDEWLFVIVGVKQDTSAEENALNLSPSVRNLN